MDPFYIDILLFSVYFTLVMIVISQKRFLFFKDHQVYITDTSTRLFGKLNKNVERFIKDFNGSYETIENRDRVYAFIKVKRLFGNFYHVGKDRILFRESEMHNLIDGERLIKSNSGISKFKL